MAPNSLLAALTLRLHSHPENIATEALLHILNTHSTAAEALASLLHHAGLPELGPLYFQSQVYGDKKSIPDLVGTDVLGQERLVIEAKFWAHLTDKQPEIYLSRLDQEHPSVLLFICPESRQSVLWDQVTHRAQSSGTRLSQDARSHTITWATAGISTFLAILSWRALLGSIAADAAAHNDQLYLADVGQLQGLCERMDSEAFLPIRPEELSQEIGRRVSQYADLIDDAVNRLSKEEFISIKGLATGGSHGSYGRFFRYKEDIGCFLNFSPLLWASPGTSPIWLEIKLFRAAMKWITTPHLKSVIHRCSADRPNLVTESMGSCHRAILLECGSEKDIVIASIVQQTMDFLAQVDDEIQKDKSIGRV